MKAKKFSSRLLAMLLMAMMVISVLPVSAANETASSRSVEGGLVLDKTATLADDGTYTINLEAYATGENVVVKSTVPADVVLVLDVSGSMEDDYTYVVGENWVPSDEIIKNHPTNVYHKCADGTYSTVTWSQSGGLGDNTATHRYVCDHCKATRKWSAPFYKRISDADPNDPWNLYELEKVTETKPRIEALQEAANAFINGVAEKNAELTDPSQQHRVSIVKFASESTIDTIGNDTYKSDSYTYNYTQVVAGLTVVDSSTASELCGKIDALVPGGATASDKGLELATGVLNDNDAEREKIVIIFTDGEPTYGNAFQNSVASSAVTVAKGMKDEGVKIYTVATLSGADPSDTSSDINKYMNAMSSNYPAATITNSSSFTVDLGAGGNNGYYKVATDSAQLTNIFKEISESIGTASVSLDQNAVARDILADGFILPDGFSESNVTVKTDKYSGRDRNGTRVFANDPQALSGAKVTIDGNTINVSGFDYAGKCLIDGETTNAEDFTSAKQGEKLIITITGVEATDSAITGESVYTNDAASGIYKDSVEKIPSAEFPMPTTKLTSKSYVLDYANPVTLSPADWEQSSVTSLDDDGMHKFTGSTVNLDMTYGMVEAGNNGLAYTPQTTKWDGYDSFYAFGKTAENKNMWSKVNVIPANNVYYEDDFITNEKNGTVGIEYSGDWTTVGTEAENTNTSVSESGNNAVHGWESSYADDSQFSEGSAHGADKGAKATFEFTGTGVDIYSKTDMTSGVVRAKLSKKNAEGTLVGVKGLVVNDLSASGEYYQIPTLFFSDLDYGTYTVEITVMTQAETEGGYTYYLDGIRVYNPLDPTGTDEVVDEAYGADETGALFTSVRNVLLEAGTVSAEETANGAVFIDKNADGSSETTSSIATYKDYGPKNEVYIPAGKAIVFNVTDIAAESLYVGLKSPNGGTTAKVTNGNAASEIAINTAADMYYRITPNTAGNVLIENQGAGLLAVTKLRTAGMGAEEEISLFNSVSTMSLLSYADEFDSLAIVEYNTENDVIEVPETPVEPDEPSDVEIENPEPEQPKDDVLNSIVKLLEKIFGGFRGWFK